MVLFSCTFYDTFGQSHQPQKFDCEEKLIFVLNKIMDLQYSILSNLRLLPPTAMENHCLVVAGVRGLLQNPPTASEKLSVLLAIVAGHVQRPHLLSAVISWGSTVWGTVQPFGTVNLHVCNTALIYSVCAQWETCNHFQNRITLVGKNRRCR